ncbi:MAG: zf-HC2 domain-containing protein [Chloroflexi bacterium]|nr:zf-HC2 domain-containing protein [Chloroflexota bacterium]
MACRELVALITEYLEAALPQSEQERLEGHLSECSGCRAYLEQMRQTIRTLGILPKEPVPPDVREKLLQAFRAWKSG